MPGIHVNCGNCGHSFEVGDDLAGLIAACPGCGTQLSVPLPAGRLQRKPALRVKHEQVVSGGRRCPSCGATMAADAILCVQCGFNVETGESVGARSQRPRVFQWVLWGVGLVILAGLGRALYHQRAGSGAAGPQVVPPPVREKARPENAAAPQVPAATAVAAVQPAVSTQAEAEAKAEMARQEELRLQAKMEQEYRAVLTERVNQRYPVFTLGETSVLRRANGLVHRGVYAGVKQDTVVIFADKQRVEVPLKALDQASRLRCDPLFRKQLIDYQVKKKMAEFAPPQGS